MTWKISNFSHPTIVTDGLVLNLDAFDTAGYDGTNTITDLTGNKNNGTLTNGASHTDGPFVGAGYVEFDGNGDYLDIASSTDFAFETGDFTIEVWVYLKSNALGVIYSNEIADSLFLYVSSGTFVVRNYATTNLITTAAPSTNTWTHIAVTRSGTDFRLFFNGVQQGSTVTDSTNWTQNGTEIGAYGNGTWSLNGYMSNFRVVKGTALYTSNFTPPTKPLTAVTNTVLLTCQGNTIADASSSGHTITANGNAAASLGYPASSFEFDGTDDYINIGTQINSDITLTDVSISFWAYIDSTASDKVFAATGNLAANIPLVIWYDTVVAAANNTGSGDVGGGTTNAVTVMVTDSSNADRRFVTSDNALSATTWHNISVVLDVTNNAFYTYIDGTEKAKWVSTNTCGGIRFTSLDFLIGGGSPYLDGRISNFLVYTKALTSTEVTQNYNALKWRYGL